MGHSGGSGEELAGAESEADRRKWLTAVRPSVNISTARAALLMAPAHGLRHRDLIQMPSSSSPRGPLS